MTVHHEDASPGLVRLLQRFAVASSRYTERAGAGRGLHRSDLHALQEMAEARLDGRDSMTPSELARALGLSPSATTSLVDRLAREGHVVRVPDVTDRRRVALDMTPRAGAEARAMYGPLAAAMQAAEDELDAAEAAVVARFLRRATAVVEAQERAL